MVQGERTCTFVTFLKPTVRMSRAVKAREAEFRISHAGAAMAPIAVATPTWHTCPWVRWLPGHGQSCRSDKLARHNEWPCEVIETGMVGRTSTICTCGDVQPRQGPPPARLLGKADSQNGITTMRCVQ